MVQTALFILQVSGPWTSLPQEHGDECLVPRLTFQSLFPSENIEEHPHKGTLCICVSLQTSCWEHDKGEEISVQSRGIPKGYGSDRQHGAVEGR